LMLYGVKKDRQHFIIPYMVMEIIFILLSIAAFIVCIYVLGYNYGTLNMEQQFLVQLGLQPGQQLSTVLSQSSYSANNPLLIAVVLCAIILGAFNVYCCCNVVSRTYTFIKEKKLAGVTENAVEPVHVITVPHTDRHDLAPHSNSVHPEPPANHP